MIFKPESHMDLPEVVPGSIRIEDEKGNVFTELSSSGTTFVRAVDSGGAVTRERVQHFTDKELAEHDRDVALLTLKAMAEGLQRKIDGIAQRWMDEAHVSDPGLLPEWQRLYLKACRAVVNNVDPTSDHNNPARRGDEDDEEAPDV